MTKFISETIKKILGPQVAVFLCAMLPVIELRGAVPVARVFDLPWIQAFIISFLGNMVPIPFILLFISAFLQFLKKFKSFKKIVEFIERKAKKATSGRENITFWGLVFFVAIPLPGTGGWTGALVADFLGIKFWKALTAVMIGVFIADVVVTAIVYGSISMLSFFAG